MIDIVDHDFSLRLFATIVTVFFVTASWGCDLMSRHGDPCLEDEETVEVVIVASDINRGMAITEDNTTTYDIPTRFSPASPLLASDLDIFMGEEVYFDLPAGEMIMTHHFQDHCE